jgi:hypothetical protein
VIGIRFTIVDQILKTALSTVLALIFLAQTAEAFTPGSGQEGNQAQRACNARASLRERGSWRAHLNRAVLGAEPCVIDATRLELPIPSVQ